MQRWPDVYSVLMESPIGPTDEEENNSLSTLYIQESNSLTTISIAAIGSQYN